MLDQILVCFGVIYQPKIFGFKRVELLRFAPVRANKYQANDRNDNRDYPGYAHKNPGSISDQNLSQRNSPEASG